MIGCSSNSKNIENPIIKHYNLETSYFAKHHLPRPNSFKSREINYLVARNDTQKKYGYTFCRNYNDPRIERFYKDLKLRGYGDCSPYWRWHISISKKDFYESVARNIKTVYYSNGVLTLSHGEWKRLPIKNFGKIKNVDIAGRGKSGIVTYVVVKTTTHTYLISKELNVRRLFRFSHSVKLYRAKGGDGYYNPKYTLNSYRALLPSGYFTITKGNYINIYGGGSGHGVGMAQFTAHDLAKNYGYNYRQILARHYPNAPLRNMYSIKGVSKIIKVGITDRGSLDHSKVILTSNGYLHIKGAGFKINVPRHQKVVIRNHGNRLWVSVNGRHRVKTVHSLYISANGYYITLHDLKRTHTSSPSYRGDMKILPSPTNSLKIRVINFVRIEDYLKQVVPSEMPKSFNIEALKAQAVAARTYALSDFLKGRYARDGFHVKDTTESQMYNNQKENERATQAINTTKGKVLLFENKPIDAKYFSTSSGFTESAKYVW